jgi:hypothetical protein
MASKIGIANSDFCTYKLFVQSQEDIRRLHRLTQIKISIIFDGLIVEIKTMGKVSGLEHKRRVYCTYLKEKICGNLRNLWIG